MLHCNTNMNVRKAILQDIEKLSILFNGYRIFYKKPADLSGAKDFLKNRMENNESEIFIAENSENELLGFIQLYPVFSSTRMKKLWLLNDLFVSKEHRRKGISVLLLERAKLLCVESNAAGLMLETAKTNIEGNALYPKAGFSKDTEHHFYYWENG